MSILNLIDILIIGGEKHGSGRRYEVEMVEREYVICQNLKQAYQNFNFTGFDLETF
jgi:hypothetical protein